MGRIRILLVEDEDLHAEKIKFYLENLEYTLAGHAKDGAEAYRLFCATAPDLVLLDINLQGQRDGVQLAAQIRLESSVPIIFITSLKDRDTIDRAKETEPEAYLLKPLEEASLEAAIELALFRHAANKPDQPTRQNFEWEQDLFIRDHLFIKVGRVLKKISVEEVMYVQTSADKYCDVHTHDRSYSIRSSLSDLESRLSPDQFIRVHRAYIINTEMITEVNETEMKVKVAEHSIPIGRSYKQQLFQRLNYLG